MGKRNKVTIATLFKENFHTLIAKGYQEGVSEIVVRYNTGKRDVLWLAWSKFLTLIFVRFYNSLSRVRLAGNQKRPLGKTQAM